MNRKLYLLLAVIVLASMVLSACAPVAAAQLALTQTADSVHHRLLRKSPITSVSEYSNMTYSAWLDQIVGASLVTWDDKNNLVAELAAEVPSAANGDVSADGLTITCKLKPNLKWSDGKPLTSKDVLFTWQQQVDPKNAPISRSGYSRLPASIHRMTMTAVLHFSTVYACLARSILGWSEHNWHAPSGPHPSRSDRPGEECRDPSAQQSSLARIMIKEWVAGDHMTLVPNPNYYGSQPKLEPDQHQVRARS